MIKAVRCHRFCGIDDRGKPLDVPGPLRDVLRIDEIPAPTCRDDMVLVRVHYAGIQYPDALQAQGLYQEKPALPYVPGMDVTGTVMEVWDGVEHVTVGDQVVALNSTGGLAQQSLYPSANVWKLPPAVTMAECANLGRNYFAAYHSLRVIGEVGEGDLVLVDGASGGVGMAAIGLAKAMGAKVIAGVGSEEKMKGPEEAGADRVFCYGRDLDRHRLFKKQVKEACEELGHADGVDVVIDVVQGDLFEAALVSSVRPLGKICLIGFTAGQKPIRPGLLLIKQAAVVGSLWGPWSRANPEAHRKHVSEVLEFIASGKVKPTVGAVFPLHRYIEAFELFEQNRGRANTVVQLVEG